MSETFDETNEGGSPRKRARRGSTSKHDQDSEAAIAISDTKRHTPPLADVELLREGDHPLVVTEREDDAQRIEESQQRPDMLEQAESFLGQLEKSHSPPSNLEPSSEAIQNYPSHPQAGLSSSIPNPPGTKAKRKRASPHQLALLNQIYEHTTFPSTELRNAIGKELGMAPRTVQIWFQNRRQAWKSQRMANANESPRSTDNERGGWEVLRSFQARRANGEIQEYEYLAIPSPSNAGGAGNGVALMPFHPGMMQVALSSNDQFNSSMQQVPMPLPHTPRPYLGHNQALSPAVMNADNTDSHVETVSEATAQNTQDLLAQTPPEIPEEPAKT